MPRDTNKKAGLTVPTTRDLAYFALLDRHHLLDTGQLFIGTQEHGKNYRAHQRRLTNLELAGFVRHVAIPSMRSQNSLMHIYELTDAGREALLDGASRYARRKRDPYLHRYATGSGSFSYEYGCKKRPGLQYISFEDHLRDPRCPEERRTSKENPLIIPTSSGKIEPDELVGIRYVEAGKALFIADERDQRTEVVNPTVHRDSTIAQKVYGYVEIIRERKYRAHWGIPNLMVHFSTISEIHKEEIKDFVRDNVADKRIARCFLFSFNGRFVPKYWTTTPVGYDTVSPPGKRQFLVPRDIFVEDIMATPIETVDGVYDLTVPH